MHKGDVVSFEDAKRVRAITGMLQPARQKPLCYLLRTIGAHSAMIATAAEANPTCFSPEPLIDLPRTFIPSYLRLVSLSIRAMLQTLHSWNHRLDISTTTGRRPNSARLNSKVPTLRVLVRSSLLCTR